MFRNTKFTELFLSSFDNFIHVLLQKQMKAVFINM